MLARQLSWILANAACLEQKGGHLLQFYAVLRLRLGRMPTLSLLRPVILNPFTQRGVCIWRNGPAELDHLPVTTIAAPCGSRLRWQAAG
jgi:hypothetical protein